MTTLSAWRHEPATAGHYHAPARAKLSAADHAALATAPVADERARCATCGSVFDLAHQRSLDERVCEHCW